jgi:hypothetical protein
MAEKSKKASRHPLCEMTPVLIDILRDVAEEEPHWGHALAFMREHMGLPLEDARLLGASGLRAAYVLKLAEIVFDDEEEDHWGPRYARDRFLYCLSAKDIERRVRHVRLFIKRHGYTFTRKQILRSEAMRWISGPQIEYQETPRSGGRPREPSVSTIVRAWTIDALCELAGLPLPEAIEVWNRRFATYSLNAEASFRIERGRVRRWLGEQKPRRQSRGT